MNKLLWFSLVFVMSATTAYSQYDKDDYENNNSRQSASNIVEGEVQEHTIYPARDKDWFIFESPQKGKYQIILSGQTLNLKGDIYLQKGMLPPIKMGSINSVGSGNDLNLLLTPDMPGVKYFIGVWADNNISVGRYDININDASVSKSGNVSLSTILKDGLIAYYPFNGNANDESGNGYHGIVNGATITSDRFGNSKSSFSFNGFNGYIKIPNSTELDGMTAGFTLVVWFKTTKSSYHYFVNKMRGNSGTGLTCSYQLFMVNNNPQIFLVNSDGQYQPGLSSNISIIDNQWHLITGTWDRPITSLYIDGKLVSRSTNFDYSSINNTNEDLYFGAVDNNHKIDFFYKGLLDDIRIYNRALSESEIQLLYQERGWK
jgi:hypothetical protein